ncbi:MAG: T9SS type A sorting domain-containing protein [Bacteroidota bacterium]|jgi:hypothetical protein
MNHYFFLFSLILILAVSPAYGQILNAGFEDWTNGTPDEWLTNDASGINPITPSTSCHSGSFAVKGTAIRVGSTDAEPVLLAGGNGNGFSINTRPEALHGFYVFVPSYNPFFNDTLVIGITVSKQDTVIGVDTLWLANATDSYQEFAANIHYVASGTPDLINITVTIGRFGYWTIGTYFLLDDLSFGPAVSVDEPRTTLPSGFELAQNYPNPFNPTTRVSFVIGHWSFVNLGVYDVLGREVATLVNEVKQPGEYTVVWNAEGIASGMYLYELRSGAFSQTRKLILAK